MAFVAPIAVATTVISVSYGIYRYFTADTATGIVDTTDTITTTEPAVTAQPSTTVTPILPEGIKPDTYNAVIKEFSAGVDNKTPPVNDKSEVTPSTTETTPTVLADIKQYTREKLRPAKTRVLEPEKLTLEKELSARVRRRRNAIDPTAVPVMGQPDKDHTE